MNPLRRDRFRQSSPQERRRSSLHLDIRLGDRLSTRDQTLISEFIDDNELGLALEQTADVLSEEDQPLTTEQRSDMLRLAARMERATACRELCRSVLSADPPGGMSAKSQGLARALHVRIRAVSEDLADDLSSAIEHTDAVRVRRLLDMGADVNQYRDGWTPLHHAVDIEVDSAAQTNIGPACTTSRPRIRPGRPTGRGCHPPCRPTNGLPHAHRLGALLRARWAPRPLGRRLIR